MPRFGEHSTGQSKAALAQVMGIRGRVVAILDAINSAHVEIDELDALALNKDPRVSRVERVMKTTTQANQFNPGWALDRLDQTGTILDGQHIYNTDGTGQTIYVLDSGLTLSNPAVAAEFGGRASVLWDVNGSTGSDCLGHGTQVASAAAGKTFGVAKGAAVVIAKITRGCTGSSDTATWATAFNWLAVNGKRGDIVNLSSALSFGSLICGSTAYAQAVEDAIRAAYNAGIIVVVAAGNDQCNTANTHQQECLKRLLWARLTLLDLLTDRIREPHFLESERTYLHSPRVIRLRF
jgi:subtilisin family serine protease